MIPFQPRTTKDFRLVPLEEALVCTAVALNYLSAYLTQ